MSKDESPPFFSSWNAVYVLVVAVLVVVGVLFYIFTRIYE